MSMQFRSSPAIRSRSSGRQNPPRAGFAVQDKAESIPRPPIGGATRIFKGAIVIIALLAGSMALWSATRGPDPHYLRARKMVSDHEFGKPLPLVNYEHPVYGKALVELAHVDPKSISAEPAEALRIEIERNIEVFRQHQAEIAERQRETRFKTQRREALEFQVRAYSKLIPYDHDHHPECE